MALLVEPSKEVVPMACRWLMLGLSLGWFCATWGQEAPHPPGPSTFKQALQEMGEKLSSREVVQRFLQGLSLLEAARWWESLSPTEEEAAQLVTQAGAKDLLALQGAYLAGGIEAAVKELERQGVTLEKIIPPLLEWAEKQPTRLFIERALFADRSEYDLLRILKGDPPLSGRLARFQQWVAEGWSAGRIWREAWGQASLLEMVEVILGIQLPPDDRVELFRALGLQNIAAAEAAYRLQDPVAFVRLLEKEGYTAERFRNIIGELAEQVNPDEVLPILEARERAMSRWLQTTGPGVKAVYIGWYQRPLEKVDLQAIGKLLENWKEGSPLPPALEPFLQAEPELTLVLYEEGTLRAAWLSKEGEPAKVTTFYEGKLDPSAPWPRTLSLKVNYARLGLLAVAKNLQWEEVRTLGEGTWLLAQWEGKPVLLKRHIGYRPRP